jgi:hypothetical protein
MWVIEVTEPQNYDIIKTLKSYLANIHVERECLHLVLHMIRRGEIPVIPFSSETDELQRFLYKSTRFIFRTETRTSDKFSKEVAYLARKSTNATQPDDKQVILDALKGIRPSIWNRIEDLINEDTEMIDPTALPILMKAIDFIFGEGSKILQERRERRQREEGQNQEAKKNELAPEETGLVASKSDLLAKTVNEKRWKMHESDVESILEQIKHYKGRRNLAMKRYAIQGINVGYETLQEIEETENEIEKAMKELEVLLSEVFHEKISVE